MIDLDRDLLTREPSMPGLRRVLDRAATAELLTAAGWELAEGPESIRAVRLRWKPRTSVRAGVIVETSGGVDAVLVMATTPDGERKVRRLHERARSAGVRGHLDPAEHVAVVGATADPALEPLGALFGEPEGDLARGLGLTDLRLEPVAYNPARRWVGVATDRSGVPRRLVKLHATTPPGRVVERAAVAAGCAVVPRSAEALAGRAVTYPYLTWHRTVDPVTERKAAWSAAHTLHRLPGQAAAPVLTRAGLLTDCSRAAASLTAIWPAQGRRLAALLPDLARALPADTNQRVVLHGDLSPDQVLIDERTSAAVLCDLDRAAVGPPGWDDATWEAALVAGGRSTSVSPPAAGNADDSALRAAAALVRAVEPFRRRDPSWPQRTSALVDMAEETLGRRPTPGGAR
jgi:hypothetical protein